MKNLKKLALGTLSFSGAAVGFYSKNPFVKITSFAISLVSGYYLAKKLYNEEYEKLQKQQKEISDVLDETGLDPAKIENTSLLTTDNEETTPIAGIILKEIHNNSILSDEILEYNIDSYYNTLHIMQNVDKKRVIISIPLPPKTNKDSLSPQDIREYYKTVFDEFIEENKLDMKNFLNQIGVSVIKGKDNYTYYEEIIRKDNETFHDYINRIIGYQNESQQTGKAPKGLPMSDGDTFLRIEQYLNLEFPVFPEYSNKKGLDLILAIKLIKILSETAYIKSSKTGREIEFDLNHVQFHPTDDYGFILVRKGNEIITVGI